MLDVLTNEHRHGQAVEAMVFFQESHLSVPWSDDQKFKID